MRIPLRRILALTVGICAVCTIQANACTSIMVGRKASTDGSVMTSHTCDGHREHTNVEIIPAKDHAPGEVRILSKRENDDTAPMKRVVRKTTGTIPEVPHTYAYIAPVYACMNEHQLAIGESTWGGRPEMQSDKGLVDCDTLTRLILERAKTAREAIRVAGELIEKHGWCDVGETLTIADTKEAWVMEIIGPGKDAIGAVWAAQRVPDDHITVIANGSRIGEIDLTNSEYFMASSNVKKVAQDKGLWNPKNGPFHFYEAYNPDSRYGVVVTRREWRVFDQLAPSLKLNPNANVYPFSIKPEKPVSPEKIMELFRDTYEGTDFDVVKNLTVTDASGKTVKSPMANPFMPTDLKKMLRINGAMGVHGERCLAVWFSIYITVTQSRDWLPNPVGGVTWFGYGNGAMTTYVPIYAGVTDLTEDFKTDGRTTGFSRRSAWWAFNRVAMLAAKRWGDMQVTVGETRNPLQEALLSDQKVVVEQAAKLFKEDPAKAKAFLTNKTMEACRRATDAYWNLGDLLWTKYQGQW